MATLRANEAAFHLKFVQIRREHANCFILQHLKKGYSHTFTAAMMRALVTEVKECRQSFYKYKIRDPKYARKSGNGIGNNGTRYSPYEASRQNTMHENNKSLAFVNKVRETVLGDIALMDGTQLRIVATLQQYELNWYYSIGKCFAVASSSASFYNHGIASEGPQDVRYGYPTDKLPIDIHEDCFDNIEDFIQNGKGNSPLVKDTQQHVDAINQTIFDHRSTLAMNPAQQAPVQVANGVPSTFGRVIAATGHVSHPQQLSTVQAMPHIVPGIPTPVPAPIPTPVPTPVAAPVAAPAPIPDPIPAPALSVAPSVAASPDTATATATAIATAAAPQV